MQFALTCEGSKGLVRQIINCCRKFGGEFAKKERADR